MSAVAARPERWQDEGSSRLHTGTLFNAPIRSVEKFQRRDNADNEPLFAQPSTSVLNFPPDLELSRDLRRSVMYLTKKTRLILQLFYIDFKITFNQSFCRL